MSGVRTPLLLGYFAVAVLLLVGGDIALADDGDEREGGGTAQVELAGPPPPKPRYPKLDSRLNRLAVVSGLDASPNPSVNVPLNVNVPVAVTIRVSGDVSGVLGLLESGGATVANVGVDYIEAQVPVELLVPLAEREGVLRVESIVPPQPDVTSQGAIVHGSPAWNARGFTGQGVKVGIIDVGFQGYAGLMGPELPATVLARCYTAIGTFTSLLSDCETGGVHGTAVAEAVADVAPGASLYIANPFTPGDLQATALWMASQGATVINMSLSWIWDGPGDGTSPFSDSPLNTVGLAVDDGAVWVNSAGNSALANWFGGYSDGNGNGWIEFAPTREVNAVQLFAGETLTAQLRWDDDWGAATSDFDLYLYDASVSFILESSEFPQQGGVGHIPREKFNYTAPATGTYYLAVYHFSGTVPSWLQLNAFTQQELDISVASYSIVNPAESLNTGVLAVGAAKWSTPSVIESFSSRGPTTDGKTKPDIVGADGGDSVSKGPGGFFGTSQSSPHVAGLAALVIQQFPDLSPEQVAGYLKAQASPRGDVPNNTWGYGLAQLPLLVPGAPTNVTAVPGDGHAAVSWTAPADGGSPITQYTVTSDPGEQAATVDGTTTTAVVTGLSNGTPYTFTVTATNAVGAGASSAPSDAIVPANLPPAVQAIGDFAVGEGEALDLALASSTDPDLSDTHTWVIDWGDGTTTTGAVTEPSSTGSVSGSHTYADDGIYTVTVTVTDSAGGVGSDGVTVTVNNVAPIVDAGPDWTATGPSLILGRVVTYTDPGVLDTHTAVIDWGDGTVEAATIDQSAMTIEGSHRYDETGVYTVTFTVTDDDGGSGSDSLLLDVQVAPAVVSIPGLSVWGLALLSGALGLLLVVRVRRRAAA